MISDINLQIIKLPILDVNKKATFSNEPLDLFNNKHYRDDHNQGVLQLFHFQ